MYFVAFPTLALLFPRDLLSRSSACVRFKVKKSLDLNKRGPRDSYVTQIRLFLLFVFCEVFQHSE